VFEFLGALGSIVLIDLVLSGDNALVIGAAAAGLPKKQRWYAIVLGGGGAIILRIAFAFAAAFLLRLPLLQAIGGILLLLIAIRILMGRDNTKHKEITQQGKTAQEDKPASAMDRQTKSSFWGALFTILVADVTMSLDNVLAIGALAARNLPLLAGGLLLSIVLLLLGSMLIAKLIGRLPWLLDIAALILVWTAANMIIEDIRLAPVFEHFPWAQFALPAVAFAIVIVADILLRVRSNKANRKVK
jgi:YjbE family integral membrane protein